jgi:hypothetical protein
MFLEGHVERFKFEVAGVAMFLFLAPLFELL